MILLFFFFLSTNNNHFHIAAFFFCLLQIMADFVIPHRIPDNKEIHRIPDDKNSDKFEAINKCFSERFLKEDSELLEKCVVAQHRQTIMESFAAMNAKCQTNVLEFVAMNHQSKKDFIDGFLGTHSQLLAQIKLVFTQINDGSISGKMNSFKLEVTGKTSARSIKDWIEQNPGKMDAIRSFLQELSQKGWTSHMMEMDPEVIVYDDDRFFEGGNNVVIFCDLSFPFSKTDDM